MPSSTGGMTRKRRKSERKGGTGAQKLEQERKGMESATKGVLQSGYVTMESEGLTTQYFSKPRDEFSSLAGLDYLLRQRVYNFYT